MLAAIRATDAINVALLVHVLGALLLIGGLVTALAFQYAGWRRERPEDALALSRLAFKSLLIVAFPAWIIMRVGAGWVYSKEKIEGTPIEDQAWIGIGFITAELGGLLLLVSIILAGIGVRKLRTGGGSISTLMRISTVLVTLLVLAYIVAVWAMGAKPE